jgi:hypothetical protein
MVQMYSKTLKRLQYQSLNYLLHHLTACTFTFATRLVDYRSRTLDYNVPYVQEIYLTLDVFDPCSIHLDYRVDYRRTLQKDNI